MDRLISAFIKLEVAKADLKKNDMSKQFWVFLFFYQNHSDSE